MAAKGKRLNLAGERYGRLTVIEPAANVDGKTAWLCQCDCGNRVVAKTRQLRGGHMRSCGCVYALGITKQLNYVEGTCVEILRAKKVRRNNTSGVSGVDWQSLRGCWRATIGFKGKRYYLGSFKSFEEAVAARKQAEARLHDEFLERFAEGK